MYWPKSKVQTVLTAFMSVAFVIVGIAKLWGVEMMKEGFEGWGFPYPILFMRIVGLCEVAGAIGLWLPRFSHAAKICLIILMAGAVLTHLLHREFQDSLGAIILLIFAVVTLILHRKERDTNDELMPAG